MSTLTGTVVDAPSKSPLPGVAVTASAPQGKQTVQTDAVGNYVFPDLLPATYTLDFELDGFRPFTRSGVELPLNRTIRVNVELLPAIENA